MAYDGRGVCSISLDTCGGTEELENWMRSKHASMSNALNDRMTCYVGGDAARYNACMQQAATFLGAPVQGSGGIYFAPYGDFGTSSGLSAAGLTSWYAFVESGKLTGCPVNPAPLTFVNDRFGVTSVQLTLRDMLPAWKKPLLGIYSGNARYNSVFGGTGTFPVSGAISCDIGAGGLVGIHPEAGGVR